MRKIESGQNLLAKYLGSLLALIVQHKVTALALREISFGALLALRLGQILLHIGIRAQFERMFP